MDVGDAVQDYLSVEALGDVFDFYIWSGTPREAMTAYGTLTGLPISHRNGYLNHGLAVAAEDGETVRYRILRWSRWRQ